MASSYKTLGQFDVTSATLQDIYTVPSATEAVLSTIVIANRAATTDTFRIAIRTDGDAISNKHYIAYDVTVQGNDSVALTMGVTIQATDVVSVSGTGSSALSVNLFGSEITV